MYHTTVLALLFLSLTTAEASKVSGGFLEYYAKVKAGGKVPRDNGIVLPLTRRDGPTPSDIRRRNARRALSSENGTLTATLNGVNFLAEVTIGGQPFQLIADSGSADLWVPSKDVSCTDENGKAVDQAKCAFGKLYQATNTSVPVSNSRLNTSYASGEFMGGPMVTEKVSMGGIGIDKSQVGIVDKAFWNGDGVNSGIIGLGQTVFTSAQDTQTKKFTTYNPPLINMFAQNITSPFFSMVIENDKTSGAAGFLSVGTLPPVAHEAEFTTAPIVLQDKIFGEQLQSPTFTDYVIDVGGFNYKGQNGTTGGVQKFTMVVDSGTAQNVVPTQVVNEINALWNPPGTLDKESGSFKVDCAATAPNVEVMIAGKAFAMKAPQIVKFDDGCFSGWEDGGNATDHGTFVLGDVFMSNVVSVFDVGAVAMHFANKV